MKRICTLLIGIVTLLQLNSCSSGTKTPPANDAEKNGSDSLKTREWFPEYPYDTLTGLYTGNFGDGFINIFITYANNKKAVGYNIHKGLQRNLSGDVIEKKDGFEITLNEPGDNPYDGVFVLNISKKDFSADATWTAKDPKIASKTFKLTRKKKAADETTDEKFYYDGGPITEDNFLEIFGYSNLESGSVHFDENGLVTFTYYPDGQKAEQMETIKGSWKFNTDKSVLIEWAKNTHFKERSMKFKLVQKKDEDPVFKGPGEMEITLNYF